jgi:hypothetical protein
LSDRKIFRTGQLGKGSVLYYNLVLEQYNDTAAKLVGV